MEYEQIPIHSLIPSDYNPRIMSTTETRKLEKNLKQFGLVDPIIINLKNKHIIGGHQRYSILLEKYGDVEHDLNLIRLGDIGWVFEDTNLRVTDENHEKALNLSLNRLDGEFDTDLLGELLEELGSENFDMELTGFEDYELIEYTLDDYTLDIEEDTKDSTDEDLFEFEDSTDEETYTANITFNSVTQRRKFLGLLQQLQQEDENKDKTVTQIIIEYLEKHQHTPLESVPEYVLLFENKEEKDRYNKAIRGINDNKTYTTPEIIRVRDENEV